MRLLIIVSLAFTVIGCGDSPTAPSAPTTQTQPTSGPGIHIAPLPNESHALDLPPCTGSRCIDQ